MNIKQDAFECYEQLTQYAKKRKNELSDIYKPYVELTDDYGRQICHLTLLLGRNTPITTQDKVVRDLIADIFDSLYESGNLVISGKFAVSFPTIRRAYESLSLMALCCHDASYAEKWESGKQLDNKEIRTELAKYPTGETESATKVLYKFFSKGSHVNRELVPYRYLGEGNEFVLGSIGTPDLLMTTLYLMRHLGLWYWFVAVVTYFYRDIIDKGDVSYIENYFKIMEKAQEIDNWLNEKFKNLFNEMRDRDNEI